MKKLLVLAALVFVHCSRCEDHVLDTKVADGSMQVTTIRRACGDQCGYVVRVTPPGTNIAGDPEQYEPFFMPADCASPTPPMRIALQPAKITVHYDAKRATGEVRKRAWQSQFTMVYVATQ